MENEAKPNVILLAKTMPVNGDNMEAVVAAAAKLCYSKVGASEIKEKLSDEKISSFVKMLAQIGHESPLEHISFTFGIEGISRTCSHQIVRHRTGKYSQQSQRYVDLSSSFKVIIPESIKNNEEAKKLYLDSIENDYNSYKEIAISLKNQYVSNGMDEKAAEKKALEDARFALPNACETKMVMTMDARNLLHFFNERCCNRAQWEIRDVANQMLDICLEHAPNVFSKAGAPCTFGVCKEGKMSCGEKIPPRKRQIETTK